MKLEFWIVCMYTYTKGWLSQDLNPLMSIYRTEIVSYLIKDSNGTILDIYGGLNMII